VRRDGRKTRFLGVFFEEKFQQTYRGEQVIWQPFTQPKGDDTIFFFFFGSSCTP
jgi:hypothetical protein